MVRPSLLRRLLPAMRLLLSGFVLLGGTFAGTAVASGDVNIGYYDFDTRCAGCHGITAAYIRRGPSVIELELRASGEIGHGGGRNPFNDIELPDLAAYLSTQDTNRYTLTGVVVDASGNGRAGIPVTISSTYLSYPPRTLLTDADGGCRFDDLPAGDHTLTAAAPGTLFNPPTMRLKAVQSVNSGSALLVAYPTNTPPPDAPAPHIIRVATTGDDQTSGRAWAAAKRTIAAGLAACPPGGELWLAEGTYYEAININDQHLYGGFTGHESRRDQRDPRQHPTTIDADPAHLAETGQPPTTAVTLSSTGPEGAGCDGVTVQNAFGDLGGGIHIGQSTTATIENCIIRWNTAAEFGGGILCDQSSTVRLTHNQITHNNANAGGAISISFDATAQILDNLLAANHATSSGALYADGLITHLLNNTIVHNLSDDGTASVLEWDASGNNANNIIAYNTAGIDSFANETTWHHNAVYGNTNFDWSNLAPGPTDIQADPRFTDPDHDDFHLRADSPCRDTGNDTLADAADLDLDAQPRRSRRHIDLGAYELPPPRLTLTRAPGGLHATWPRDETGYTLEQATGQPAGNPFTNWQPIGTPAPEGDHWTVALPANPGPTYLRLRQP